MPEDLPNNIQLVIYAIYLTGIAFHSDKFYYFHRCVVSCGFNFKF